MNVLVVTKPTNWEQFGEAASQQKGLNQHKYLEASIEAIGHDHTEHYDSLSKVKSALEELKIEYQVIGRSENWPRDKNFDAVITVGGDGTLLTASHNILSSNTPVLGIRSAKSSVGYLCCATSQNVKQKIAALQAGTARTILCHRLRADIHFVENGITKTTMAALNDFLFTNSNPAAITRYQLNLGSIKESQKSSGLWISTATGSSAAIHAAGGTIQKREDPRFQYLVRELYKIGVGECQLTHGYFDPDAAQFTIENHNSKALLALDGQRVIIPLKYGDEIIFKRAEPLRLCVAAKDDR